MKIELEERTCRGCTNTFRVLRHSKQVWHSDYCRIATMGFDIDAARVRVPTPAETWYIQTGERAEGFSVGFDKKTR